MKSLYCFFALLLVPAITTGSDDPSGIGARSVGLGGIATTLQDFWSVFNNQAGLADLTNIEAGFAYQSRFSQSELSTKSFAVVVPTKSGVFGVVATSYGFSDYSESKYGISYGRKIGENISIGGQINYQNIRLSQAYGNWAKASGELGLRANVTEELSIGMHLINPIRLTLTETPEERLPSIIRLGSAYQFSNKVFLAAEVEKAVEIDPSFSAGIEYLFTEKVALRAGVGTGPVKTNFGFGYKSNQFQFDVAAWYHQLLGFTPSLSMTYQFNQGQ